MVWGKWLTDQMWARYINNNHPFSDSSLVDAVMLHHAVSYDPTLRNLYLNGTLIDEGIYHHFLTGKNILLSTDIRFKQRARQGMTMKWKHDIFGLIASTIPLPISLTWKSNFVSSGEKIDTKYNRTKKTNIKEGGNTGNFQVENPHVETVDHPGDDTPQ